LPFSRSYGNKILWYSMVMSETNTPAGDGGQQTGTGGIGQQMAGNTTPEKTFTQAEVSKLMAKEKKQGRTAILRELGIDPKDKNAVENLKNLVKQGGQVPTPTGEQQTTPASDIETNRKLNEISQKLQEAERREFLTNVKAEILQSGIQPTFLDDATTLILSKQSDDDFDVKESLESLKTKHPAWFATAQPHGTKGTGNPINPGRDNNDKPDDLGERLAAQKTNSAVKKSHWA